MVIKEIITKEKYPEIYNWLKKYVLFSKCNYENYFQSICENTLEIFTLTNNKINVNGSIALKNEISHIDYPFGVIFGNLFGLNYNHINSFNNFPIEIKHSLDIPNCVKIKSLIGLPKRIGGFIHLDSNFFSNNPNETGKYNLYVDMWFKLLESVSEDEKFEYINNYSNKRCYINNCNILPQEIINNYKFDNLLKK